MNTEQIIAKRTTADNVTVLVWSTGEITDRFWRKPGPGRVPGGLLFLAADEVCSLEWAELPELFRAAKLAKGSDVAELRASLRARLPRDPRRVEDIERDLASGSAQRMRAIRERLEVNRAR